MEAVYCIFINITEYDPGVILDKNVILLKMLLFYEIYIHSNKRCLKLEIYFYAMHVQILIQQNIHRGHDAILVKISKNAGGERVKTIFFHNN